MQKLGYAPDVWNAELPPPESAASAPPSFDETKPPQSDPRPADPSAALTAQLNELDVQPSPGPGTPAEEEAIVGGWHSHFPLLPARSRSATWLCQTHTSGW